MANCFYWSKIQNLKANHNRTTSLLAYLQIAFTGQRYKIWKQITTCHWFIHWRTQLLLLVKDTKFESKSQQVVIICNGCVYCFYWSKIQNLKANHNQLMNICWLKKIAFTGQRYKIWKQITTRRRQTWRVHPLLLLVKDTKFESKSQQNLAIPSPIYDCFYWSKIQNLKANHNMQS